jgi:hypothetical protein
MGNTWVLVFRHLCMSSASFPSYNMEINVFLMDSQVWGWIPGP